MSQQDLREKLRSEIAVADATLLLPHQRRDALLVVLPEVDLLDLAVAIGSDETKRVATLLAENKVYKPTLGQLADWCVDLELRFQYVILQPYVLAQPLARPKVELS
jgi:hypothetical protein